MKCFNYFKYLLLTLAVISWPIRGAECPPEPLSCLDILSELDSIQKSFDQCCFSLNSCLDTVLAEVNALPGPCDQRIFIDQDFISSATPQITQANTTYCLVESVTGSLLVDADNVVIEMNGHSITAVVPATDPIVVVNQKNIAILGSGYVRGGGNGILINNCTNVKIDGITFEQNQVGCGVNIARNLVVQNCMISENGPNLSNQFVGMALLAVVNAKIRCCSMYNNNAGFGGSICHLVNSSKIELSDVYITNNFAGRAFLVQNSNNIMFNNCSGNNTSDGGGGIGFDFLSAADCLLKKCVAYNNFFSGVALVSCNKTILDTVYASNNNVNGIVLNNSSRSRIANSACNLNTSSGLSMTGGSDNYCFNTMAINNTDGFVRVGGINNVFLGNYAEGNGTNYTGVSGVVRFDSSVGEFRETVSCTNISPNDWNNIAVQDCP